MRFREKRSSCKELSAVESATKCHVFTHIHFEEEDVRSWHNIVSLKIEKSVCLFCCLRLPRLLACEGVNRIKEQGIFIASCNSFFLDLFAFKVQEMGHRDKGMKSIVLLKSKSHKNKTYLSLPQYVLKTYAVALSS